MTSLTGQNDPTNGMIVPLWPAHYPDPDRLRLEVTAAADTFIDAIWEVFPASEIGGIYVKGSGLKRWDSPLDYVPVLSDVDVHVLFASEEADAIVDAIETSLLLSAAAERRFRESMPDPIHTPRLQLVVANRLYREPDFVPSPPETIEERFGQPYPRLSIDPVQTRQFAIARTIAIEQYLRALPRTAMDLTGPHLRRVLRDLSWRVSPTGPRVLEILGVDFHSCWTSNRTSIARLLDRINQPLLASDYRTFYTGAWEYFLSGDMDGEPARTAIAAAYSLLLRALALARGASLER